ncbi:hypothetical protein G3I59_27250 [Amycolatopsis rubida]|uniref:Uncharacterized protein n=1 Tax=Amycolatopsis rubida TaxID=112413 RepID=A0ABX0BW06_9PSEU|nr:MULTISPECIES: hypothetical protein [Amycolatopsis]MYW94195.1 hypothetical protein [Amycolatopsis rubida]NEC59184.1 hypothetical protein [Amycolatopsis rubida]OAP20874.1 hypothetical protein A4R44_08319 [Amycolatopsis sp. M39]
MSSPSGAVVASGIKLRAGAGIAEATVASVRVGTASVGPFSATCRNGVTTVKAPSRSSGNLTVTPGASGGPRATAGTVTVKTPEEPAITVSVATVSCGSGTPPTEPPPTTHPGEPGPTDDPTPPSQAGHRPAPAEKPGRPSDRDTDQGRTGHRPAPAPTPRPGHLPVTG